MTVVRPRRGIVISLFGMAGLRGRLGPRIILETSPFSIVERVTFEVNGEPGNYILKSSALPMRAESQALYWVGEHIVSASRLLAAEAHPRGEWILLNQAPYETADPACEETLTQMVERLALFHNLTRGYPFKQLPWRDREFWAKQQPILLGRLRRLRLVQQDDVEGDHLPALARAIATLTDMLETFEPEQFVLVHGDLNAHNVVMTEAGAQAIDWGLAHVNLPVVDLARLLDSARLSLVAKQRISERYFNLLDGDWQHDQETLRRIGTHLYRLYLLEWYSRAVHTGIVPESTLQQAVTSHTHALASTF